MASHAVATALYEMKFLHFIHFLFTTGMGNKSGNTLFSQSTCSGLDMKSIPTQAKAIIKPVLLNKIASASFDDGWFFLCVFCWGLQWTRLIVPG
jgi:hypothetical protein